MEVATLLLKRPIVVWVIFFFTINVAVVAAWAALRIARAEPGTPAAGMLDEYGPGGLVVSLIPATVLLLSGLSLFLLTRRAVWVFAVNALLSASFIYTGPSVGTVVWFAVALGALAYTIWLRRAGILR